MIKPLSLLIVLLATATFMLSVATGDDDKVKIRDWDFTWTVEESGEASFTITKTDDSLNCAVWSRHSAVRMSPAQAATLGKEISNAGDVIKTLRQKGGKQTTTKNTAGGIKVYYSYNPETGAYISISEKDSFLSSVGLDTKQAEELGEVMVDAVKLAKAVNDRIDP